MEEKKVCDICGCLVDADDITVVDEKNVCSSCLEDNYSYCEYCEEYHENEDMEYVYSIREYVCLDCLADYFGYCDYCEEYYPMDNITYVDSIDACVCDGCLDEYFVTCDGCGEIINRDDAVFDEYEEYTYCQDCANKYMVIQGYHSAREIKFFGNDDNLYMGFELEVDNGNDNDATALYTRSIMPTDFMHFEHDGSLYDGYENISQPATLKYHTGLLDSYRDMMDNLSDNGYEGEDAGTCGLHIHFNKAYFGDDDELCISKLLYLVEKFWDNLVVFSRRDEANLNRWASRYNMPTEDIIERYKTHYLGRYYAVNLTNKNTIEFRLFNSTLDAEVLIATLQLVETLVKTAKNMNIEQLHTLVWADMLKYDEVRRYWKNIKNL